MHRVLLVTLLVHAAQADGQSSSADASVRASAVQRSGSQQQPQDTGHNLPIYAARMPVVESGRCAVTKCP